MSNKPGHVAEISIDQRILEIFHGRCGDVVSGAELSGLLHVSRTAIWKHINTLKKNGYTIESVPSRGYRLLSAPDLFLPVSITAGLQTRRLGKKVFCFKETTSTNAVAYKLAEDGAPEGTVVLADAQTSGKGRLGRVWLSPPGVNIYASVILRPPLLPVEASQLTFISAVAVARTIEKLSSLEPAIKWPNDILVNGNKIAGLLNEMSAETERINFVIMGIGVNLNMTAEQFPEDLRYPATSMLIAGGICVDRSRFVRRLIEEMDELYNTFLVQGDVPVREEWLRRSQMQGRMVKVSSAESVICGMVTGIDHIGGLLLKLDDGREERILSGDVSLL